MKDQTKNYTKNRDKYIQLLTENRHYSIYEKYTATKFETDGDLHILISKFHERLISYINSYSDTKLPNIYNAKQSKIYEKTENISKLWFLYEFFFSCID